MSGDAFAAVVVGGLMVLVLSVPPLRRWFHETFAVGETERRQRALYAFNPPNTQGAARFSTDADCKKGGLLKSGKGILIGGAPDSGRALRYNSDAMLMGIAPVGSGKGTSLIINNCLSLDDRSLLVFCPKGETPSVTGHYRKHLGPLHILNPYGILPGPMKGLHQSRFNSMWRLNDPKLPPLEFSPAAAKLADSIVWRDTENSEAEHFSASARELIHGVIMAVARHFSKAESNLYTVADIITTDKIWTFARMVLEKETLPAIRQMLARYAAPHADENKEFRSIVSTAATQVSFLTDPAIAECISGDDFHFSQLRERVCTVFVTVPLDKLDVTGKFFRLIVASALAELLQPHRGKTRVLVIMDEFFQYGALSAVENAFGMARGFGVQLWPILQDLNQLKGRYPRTYQTFLSNAGVRVFMTPRDENTSEYVSKQSGVTETVSYSHNVSADPNYWNRLPGVSDGMGIVTRPLILPHEARELPDNRMLVWVRGVEGVIKARKQPYYQAPEFRGKYKPNPYIRPRGILERVFKG